MCKTFVLDRILGLTCSLIWKKKNDQQTFESSLKLSRNHVTDVSPSETEHVAPTNKAKESQTQVQQDS